MLAAEEMGDADNNARRRRREKLKDMLLKIEVQLKPLMDQLARVKDLPAPEFGGLQAWEAANAKAGRASNGDSDVGDSSKTSQGQWYGGTPMPFLGETKDAFVKAYYTALAERQREQEAATREMQNEEGHNMMPSIISNGVSAAPSDRHVGMKSKREDDGDDDIEWD
ncbi:hypothetical protein QJS04_geneDACA022433 [Acorus gramineus]|uniref:Uncharacterized protein n=1 Tax=Acorus gramineus TaxID=55184 RepID=A0AAV9BD36_ACOGR|nr:hypothetical protein QJS04_geneDACA022433 [Acorus gramineus]